MDTLLHILSGMRWQDIADITLNSYILFRLYVLFRGTYVLRVLIGIALLWFFQRIAVMLGLIVTSWLTQGIIALAAFIIIVVFRNEIRGVLQAKNFKSIFWGIPQKKAITSIDIIAESAFELAQKRIGALIVLPGKEDLEEFVQKGVSWQGSISKEMIMSIFWPDNPVHDGAAVIQGDRIIDVGCILPLSRREDLPSSYGTRHRAALGLSENTDAIVIVVSEESGKVMLAKGSRPRPIDRGSKLKQKLLEHAGRSGKGLHVYRREKLEIGAAAIVSISLMTAVWFSVSRGLDTLMTLEVPIEYMNRNPAKEIFDTTVNSVNLKLAGSGSLLKTIQPEQARVRINLDKAVNGPNAFTITQDNIELPPGVILKEVKPPVIEVTLDVLANKELPIQVDWVGKLSDHLILVAVRLDPEKITLVGGKQILEDISTIYTEKIPLDNIKKSGKISANLALNPASLKIATGFKNKITIDYVVAER
ncbi:MAG: diadenylate cyclase [Deltaproteobacteria bacterium]|nr:MAG: diadenylate cyclase [Deltaproteobacteria bacterium]